MQGLEKLMMMMFLTSTSVFFVAEKHLSILVRLINGVVRRTSNISKE